MKRVYLEHFGDKVEVPLGETIIGRDAGCSLHLDDPAVSRRHMRVIRRGHDLFVEDLGSSNGTQLNGSLVTGSMRIGDGDQLQIGGRVLTVRSIALENSAEPSTLIRNFETAVELKHMRATTLRMAAMPGPVATRTSSCSRCSAPVSELEDECASCGFSWGGFGPSNSTSARPATVSSRRHERTPIEMQLLYVSPELEIEALTRDLSESGVFVCTQVLDPIGTNCQLTLRIEDRPIDTRGIVRRVVQHDGADKQPVGLGVEFVDLREPERTLLRSVIESAL